MPIIPSTKKINFLIFTTLLLVTSNVHSLLKNNSIQSPFEDSDDFINNLASLIKSGVSSKEHEGRTSFKDEMNDVDSDNVNLNSLDENKQNISENATSEEDESPYMSDQLTEDLRTLEANVNECNSSENRESMYLKIIEKTKKSLETIRRQITELKTFQERLNEKDRSAVEKQADLLENAKELSLDETKV